MASELNEQHRKKLMGIVTVMEENGEDPGQIQAYVDQYKSKYSGETPVLKAEQIEGAKELQLPKGATFGSFVAGVGELIDRFGGAPTRAAVHKALTAPEGKMPEWEAVKGFAAQFGRDPGKAVTGREIAIEAGVPTGEMPSEYAGGLKGVSPADAVGLLADLGLDYTNIIPGKAISKIVFGTAKPIAGAGLKTIAKGADIATGTKIPSTVGKTWAETFKAGGEALKEGFGAQPVKTFEESKQIAKRLGIPEKDLPASVKYGEDSLMSLFERFEREGPLGQKLRDAYSRGAEKLEAGVTKTVKKMGTPKTLDEAGAYMQGTFDKGLDKYFDKMGVTNKSIIKNNPNLEINQEAWKKFQKQTFNAQMWAKKKMDNAITDTAFKQAEQIWKALKNVDKTEGNYASMYNVLREIGEVAFKSKNSFVDVAPDVKKFRALYHNINSMLHKTVEKNVKGGPELIKDLRKNNKAITEMYRDKEAIGAIMGNPNMGSEKKFNAILSDTRKIQALKKFVEPKDMGQIKASFLENIIIKRGEDDKILWKGMAARLRNAKRKGTINTLFEPKEMDAINDYVKLADRFGEKVLSSSGTGASNQFLEYIKTTAARVGKGLTVKPIQEISAAQKTKLPMFAPGLRKPKEYAKTTSARLKALQTYSVQRESYKRKQEANIMSEYYGKDLSKMPYQQLDKLIKDTKRMTETKNRKQKNLLNRDIKSRLINYEVI